MTTLLMRIDAPLQSWGIASLFTERDTAREPSKSGILGLVCAALGRSRQADLSDLNALRFGVRVDREGVLEKDFQTAKNILSADQSKTDTSVISTRYYLADAVFLAGLEGDPETLEIIQGALGAPRWTLYLGRKAFPPARPVFLEDGLKAGRLEAELRVYPLLFGSGTGEKRLVIEDDNGEFQRRDVPLNFARREFGNRRVKILLETCGQEKEG